MIVDGVAHRSLRDQRRDDNGRDARAVEIKRKGILIRAVKLRAIARRGRSWRRGVIEEAAVLIPNDDEHAGGPNRGVAQRVVSGFDKRFAAGDAIERVLGIATNVVGSDAAVVGLDPGELRGIFGIGYVFGEIGEWGDIPDVDALQGVREGKELVAGVDFPVQAGDLEDAAILIFEAVNRFPKRGFLRGWTVVELGGRAAERKKSGLAKWGRAASNARRRTPRTPLPRR